MTAPRQVMSSAYMNWAKTKSGAKFNLATSGMPNVSLRELRVSLDDLEITDGGYGYKPLIERKCGISYDDTDLLSRTS